MLEASSTSTSAQKIDIMIMAGPPLTGRARGYHRLRRRKDQSQFSNCEPGKRFRSALLPFTDELCAAKLTRFRCGSRPEVTFNCFDASAHIVASTELNFSWR